MTYPVKQYIKDKAGVKIPILDIPQISDEKWQQMAAAQKAKQNK